MEYTILRNSLIGYFILLLLGVVAGLTKYFGMISLIGIAIGVIYLIFKRTNYAIISILLYATFIKGIEDYFGVPHFFSYFVDMFLIILLVKSLVDLHKKKIVLSKYIKTLILIVCIFISFCLLTDIINISVEPLYFIWALRNNFRFFLFLVEAAIYIKENDFNLVYKFFLLCLPINILISLYQLFGLHLHQDLIGGLFGCTKGVNGYLNIYLCLLTLFILIKYALEKINIKKVLIVLFGILINATLAELKFYYFEFLFFLILVFFISKNRKRYLKVLLISLVVLFLIINILYWLFPMFDNFFSVSAIKQYLSYGYSKPGELNRLSAYATINKFYLLDIVHRLFGIGFGMAETSGFSFLTSNFYLNNGWIRYDWFSHAFMYIEIGLIGTVIYFIIIFYSGYIGLKKYRNKRDYLNKENMFLTIGVILIICMNFIYNSSLRSEAGYMAYFFLAIPLIKCESIKVDKIKKEDKKISVIVPVYNVEQYIMRCVDSILNQTYKNLEIILVDDGSQDRSGAKCDSYLSRDRRIRVIHKKNGGLSDARNAGLEIATGDYFAFVDSDDYLDENMFLYLMNAILETGADIAICDKKKFSNENEIIKKESDFVEGFKMDACKALKLLNELNQIDVSMCDKLFNQRLFKNLKFPYGLKSEDSFVCYKLFDRAKQLVYIPEEFYFYYQREGSISNSLNTNYDVLDAAQKQIEYFKINYPSLVIYGIINYLIQKIWIYNSYIEHNQEIDSIFLNKLQLEIRENFNSILFGSGLSINKKIVCTLIAINPIWYKKIRTIKKKAQNEK